MEVARRNGSNCFQPPVHTRHRASGRASIAAIEAAENGQPRSYSELTQSLRRLADCLVNRKIFEVFSFTLWR